MALTITTNNIDQTLVKTAGFQVSWEIKGVHQASSVEAAFEAAFGKTTQGVIPFCPARPSAMVALRRALAAYKPEFVKKVNATTLSVLTAPVEDDSAEGRQVVKPSELFQCSVQPNKTGGLDFGCTNTAIAYDLHAAMLVNMELLTPSEISPAIGEVVMDHLHGTRMRQGGGTYFLPPTEGVKDTITALSGIMSALGQGCEFNPLAILDEADYRAVIYRQVHKGWMEEVEELVGEVKEMQRQGTVQLRRIEGNMDRCNELRGRLTLYKNSLQFRTEDVQKKCDYLFRIMEGMADLRRGQ